MQCVYTSYLLSHGLSEQHVADIKAAGMNLSDVISFMNGIIAFLKANPQFVGAFKAILNAVAVAVPSLAPVINAILSLFPTS